MTRPLLKVPIEEFDRILEAIAAFGILMLVTYPLLLFDSLPDTIPRHFNFRGEPDAYGSKFTILVFPLLGVLLYSMLTWMATVPHLFNYPVTITEENAAAQYRNGVRLIRILKAVIICLFAFLTYRTIQIALGDREGLGNYAVAVVVLSLFGAIGYFFYRAFQKA